MIGALIGDISGSTYEFEENKDSSVPLFPPHSSFTDDTVMTVATAHAILTGTSYRDAYVDFGRRYPYPMGQYGARFSQWLRQPDPQPYNSWGNGSAMRAGPIGWAFSSLESALDEAEKSASVSHNHVEGIKGAQAVAAAVWLGRHGKSKAEFVPTWKPSLAIISIGQRTRSGEPTSLMKAVRAQCLRRLSRF